jgi:hypothetical protein
MRDELELGGLVLAHGHFPEDHDLRGVRRVTHVHADPGVLVGLVGLGKVQKLDHVTTLAPVGELLVVDRDVGVLHQVVGGGQVVITAMTSTAPAVVMCRSGPATHVPSL